MNRRNFNSACAVSAALVAVTIVLSISSFWLDPKQHRISIGTPFHVGVCEWIGGASWGRIVFFIDLSPCPLPESC